MVDGERVASDARESDGTTGVSRTLSRRGLLRGVLAAGVSTVSSGCLSVAGVDQDVEPIRFVSRSNRIASTDATHVVRTVEELRSALSESGATVWLPGDVKLRLDESVSTPIPIAPRVTLASDRGLDGRGALIECPAYHSTVFQSESKLRVTGLRIRGPETTYFDPRTKSREESAYYSRAVECTGDGIEIDHCELFGWTSAAVSLGAQNAPTGSRIHHNTIHHNQMQTLGYGIDVRNGTHLIEWNYFDWNRHSVAGFGHRQNGYEARFNVVGTHAVRHAFDMHGLRENLEDYSGSLAGKYIRVHHNVFALTDAAAVVLRGVSNRPSWVRENWCAAIPLLKLDGRRSVIRQSHPDSSVKFEISDNQYGPKAAERGRNWLLKQGNKARESDTE